VIELRRKSTSRRAVYFLLFLTVALILFTSTGGYVALLRRLYPVKYTEEVSMYSIEYGLDPYLILAVINAESGFDPMARSHKDAMGLMQLTEKTAKWGASEIGLRDFRIEDLYEPNTNIRLGCWYMKNLLNEFNQDVDLAIAAYNGGSGNVKKWLEDKNYSSSGKSLDRIPFRETEEFVRKVKRYRELYKKLYDALLTGGK
jgi:soluble lytic murein transglycosylase